MTTFGKKLGISIIAGALALASGTAHAQTFTYEITWGPVQSIGGMTGPDGPQYGGGMVEGTYTATYDDGTTDTGSVTCVGMDQPDGGIFAIHLTCSITPDEEGASATSVYGCNFLGKPGPETPLGCVGGMEGKTGPFAGRNGALTMEWYSETQSRGTGQWYGS